MKTENLERFLNSFGAQVKKQSRELLKQAKGDTALGKSIRFQVTPEPQGFSTKFYMEDYGTFLDKGVSGNAKGQSFTNYKGENKSSPYKYTSKGPPIDILSKWVKRKGLKPKGYGRGRSKDTGQYISGLAIYISHKIKTRGIKSISFFQIPLGIGLKEVKDKMLKELKLDIETYLTTYYRPK
jgi:hypothetical protein